MNVASLLSNDVPRTRPSSSPTNPSPSVFPPPPPPPASLYRKHSDRPRTQETGPLLPPINSERPQEDSPQGLAPYPHPPQPYGYQQPQSHIHAPYNHPSHHVTTPYHHHHHHHHHHQQQQQQQQQPPPPPPQQHYPPFHQQKPHHADPLPPLQSRYHYPPPSYGPPPYPSQPSYQQAPYPSHQPSSQIHHGQPLISDPLPPSLTDLTSSSLTSFTPQALAAFADALAPGALATLPDLGSFVYPNLPFPFASEPEAPYQQRSGNNRVDTTHRYTPLVLPFYLLTVYIATPHLLTTIPSTSDGGFKLWGSQLYGGYTDDSDLRLILIHSGFISLDQMILAKKRGNDIKVKLRVGREPRSRYVGGFTQVKKRSSPSVSSHSASPRTSSSISRKPLLDVDEPQSPRAMDRTSADTSNDPLRSFAWGNSHDGGSIEVVSCAIVERGTAHSLHAPNRKIRMAQFARHREYLNMLPQRDSQPNPDRFTSSPLISQPESRPALSLQGPKSSLMHASPRSDAGTLVGTDVECLGDHSANWDTEFQMECQEASKWSLVMSFINPRKRKAPQPDEVAGPPTDESLDDWLSDSAGASFLYDADALQSTAFPPFSQEESCDPVDPVPANPEDENDAPAKRRKVTTEAPLRTLILENEDERYLLTPSASAEEVTYTLSVLSQRAPQADNQILADRLTSSDIGFMQEGICVWLLDASTAPHPSLAPDDPNTQTNPRPGAAADGSGRTGWFCRVRTWKFVSYKRKEANSTL